MKKFALIGIALCALLFSGVAQNFAGDKGKIKTKGVKCIIKTKKAVNPSKFVEHNGGKVFFCCGGCLAKFKASGKKFSARANHQLLRTGQAKEVKCPFTGRDLNPATKIKIGGAYVCFCCFNCQKAAKKLKGAALINRVFNDKAFKKGFKVGAAE